MIEEIKVYVVSHSGRTNLTMRYRCPMTGKHVDRSTGTSRRRDALKVAAKWEAELQEGRYQKRSMMPWAEFVDVYYDDCVAALRPNTRKGYCGSLSIFERLCRPRGLADVTTARS